MQCEPVPRPPCIACNRLLFELGCSQRPDKDGNLLLQPHTCRHGPRALSGR